MNVEFDLQTHLMEMEARIITKVDEGRADVKALTGRVDKLEQWRSYLIGAWAVIVGGAGYYLKQGKS